MKILGTTENGFLIECSDDELCNLMGFRAEQLYPDSWKSAPHETSHAAKAFKKVKGDRATIDKKINWVGLSIPITNIFHSARMVAEGWNSAYSLKEASKNVRAFADSLDMLMGTYLPLKVDE